MIPKGIPYYKETSKVRKLDCPLPESLSVKAANVIYQFGDILRSIELPETWRELIADSCSQEMASNEDARRIAERRAALEAEQKRLVTAFTKGYLDEKDLDAHMEEIRAELFTLPVLPERDVEAIRQASLSVGERSQR